MTISATQIRYSLAVRYANVTQVTRLCELQAVIPIRHIVINLLTLRNNHTNVVYFQFLGCRKAHQFKCQLMQEKKDTLNYTVNHPTQLDARCPLQRTSSYNVRLAFQTPVDTFLWQTRRYFTFYCVNVIVFLYLTQTIWAMNILKGRKQLSIREECRETTKTDKLVIYFNCICFVTFIVKWPRAD